MTTPQKLEQVLGQVKDQSSFIRNLLIEGLQWDIPEEIGKIEQISYSWTANDLRAVDLDQKIVDGQVWQIQPLRAKQPWGVFVLEFKNPDVFIKGRGMVGLLRKVLRGLVPSRRRQSHLAAWQSEDILFICTHQWQYFSFMHFSQPEDGKRAARLTSFGWTPDSPNRTLLEFNLPCLAWPERPSDASSWREKWLSAFDKDKLTKEFFKRFSGLYTKVAKEISKDRTIEKDAGKLAQLLLDRLLFLYFIQKKGWLDQQSDYLYSRFLKCWEKDQKGNSYYSEVLYPFFVCLSDSKAIMDTVGAVPFLNGGLFEESSKQSQTERLAQARLSVKNSTFKEIFEGLLERFNFTVTEDTPLDIEVAIDPEMLGKIFESLILQLEKDPEKDLRKLTGSYYTPRPIVHFMCQQALKEYLIAQLAGKDEEKAETSRKKVTIFMELPPADQLDEEQIRNLKKLFTESEIKMLSQAILDCRVCDSAVGSGAFPVGMLHEMVAAIARLDVTLHGKSHFTRRNYEYDLKKNIIESCLYGVDIQEQAVRLCELRLWLSLVVDYQIDQEKPFEKAIREVPSLPNLSYRIVRGDSLLERLFGHIVQLDQMAKDAKTKQLIDEIQASKRLYFRVGSNEEKRHLELQILSKQADLAERLIEAKRATIIGYQANLFAQEGLTSKERKAKDEHESRLKDLEDLITRVSKAKAELKDLSRRKYQIHRGDLETFRRHYFHTGDSPSFMWRVDFAEVFSEKGGFDIVIGNPPYSAKITRSDWLIICDYFPNAKQSKNSAAAFLALPKVIGSNNAVVSQIVPKSLTFSNGWSSSRSLLFNDWNLLCSADTSQAFEDVLLEQEVVVYSRQRKPRLIIESYALSGKQMIETQAIPISTIRSMDLICNHLTTVGRGLVNRLLPNSCLIKDFYDIKRGKGWQNMLTNKHSIDFIQTIKGSNIRQFHLEPNLLSIRLASDIEHDLARMKHQKIVCQNIVSHIKKPYDTIIIMCAIDYQGLAALDTVNMIFPKQSCPYSLEFLCGLLNSSFARWFFYFVVYNKAIRTMHFDEPYVGKLPLPKYDNKLVKIIETAVNKMTARKLSTKYFISSEDNTYDLIDETLFLLYGLTSQEREEVLRR